MNLAHIGLHEPWAILPEYAQSYYPGLIALHKGEKFMDADYSALRQLNKSYFISEEDIDDEEFDLETNQDLSEAPEGSVAVVRLNGPVMKYSQFCGPRGTLDIAAEIKRIDANPNYVGIVFQIESGGGQVYAIKPLTDVLNQAKKPIVVLSGNYLASAAYAIAVHSKEIISDHPKAIIGSIGTMMSFQDVKPYFEGLGVVFHEIYASKSTLKNKKVNDALKGNYKSLIQDMLDPMNEDFIADVKEMRKGKIANNLAIYQGETFFASVSKSLGMIDAIGDMKYAVTRVRELSKSSSQSQTSQTQINTDMKFANLAALAANSAPTADQIDLANADLTTEGITGITLVAESFITDAAAVTVENVRLTAELATANASNETVQAQLSTATASTTTAQARLTELEAQLAGMPGSTHNQEGGSKEDQPPGGETSAEAIMENLPHNKRAAESGF
jgi:protease-4